MTNDSSSAKPRAPNGRATRERAVARLARAPRAPAVRASLRLPPEARIAELLAREQARFAETHPESLHLAAQSRAHYLYGVPMHWMHDWPAPVFVAEARGAHLVCVDGIEYVDFCLGDTAAMFGHSPPAIAAAIAREAASGLSLMLPSADAPAVGDALARVFGLPMWQFATSASDANRFMLRWARAVTGRPQIVVFDGCYHGTVDDALVDLVDGRAAPRASLLGQAWDATRSTRVVPFNDLDALAAALADGQVAALLAEPALTNCGMVLPDDGYWEAARALTARHGSLLVLDETHTISAGRGGWARCHGIAPDALVLGKPIAGGLPCAVYGFTAELGARMQQARDAAPAGHSGIGTTLAGNRLALAAVRAMLEHQMSFEAYTGMTERAGLVAKGLRAAFARHGYAWSVVQLGARLEFQFRAEPPHDAEEARAATHATLERLIHLYLLNRGVIVTPFHNMLLVSPATSALDVSRLVTAFDACLQELAAG